MKSLQTWAVLISWVYLATGCACSCLELRVNGFQLDAICWWDKSRRPLVALGNTATGWESSLSPLLPPCPAPAPAGASLCTGIGVTHAATRAPGGQDDAQHIAALSLVSFRKYKGINRLLLEARSCCKDRSSFSFGPAAVSGCMYNPMQGASGICWGRAREGWEQEKQLPLSHGLLPHRLPVPKMKAGVPAACLAAGRKMARL